MTSAKSKVKPPTDFFPSPLNLLFDFYGCKSALKLLKIGKIDLKKQMEILQRKNISTTEKRQLAIESIISNGDVTELNNYPNIRIHIKSILGRYYRESFELRTQQNINDWSETQIIHSFLHYLIENSLQDKSTGRIWEFAYYLRKYFEKDKYTGKRFLDDFNNNLEQMNDNANGKNKGYSKKGFGLQMMKNVCQAYSLKSGPFSKVKKKCNLWAAELHQQSKNANVNANKQMSYNGDNSNVNSSSAKYSGLTSIPKKPPHNYSKFVTDVSSYVSQQKQYQPPKPMVNANAIVNKRWYWLFDNYGNNLRWIPYKEVDNEILNNGWLAGNPSCNIMNGAYRVDFIRDRNDASGTQYNTQMQAGGGRNVICHSQEASIHGAPVAKAPM